MTASCSRETSLTRDVPYGSETVLIIGEPADWRTSCREALSDGSYVVLEAANLQQADTILESLDSGADLILAGTASDPDGEIAVWCEQRQTTPVLVLDSEDYRTFPEARAEIALRVRLAIEAARPSRSILIVDENEPERNTLADLLQAAGFRASEASTGKQASRLLATNTPDLLLTDIVMREMDGLELIWEVRQLYPDVAVIAMSGGARADSYLSAARLLGAKRVLKKPLSLDRLFKLLREIKSPTRD